MKKSIYFHIDELNRDTIVASALYKKLNKDFKFFFGNRLDLFKLKFFDVFDIYIFPNVESLTQSFLLPKNCKGKIYILPNESISGSHKVARRLELHLTGSIKDEKLKKKWLERIDNFFLWGNSHFKVLKRYSGKLSKKCIIAGHPRHDKSCYKKKIKKNNNKLSVGLISRFDLINVFDDRLNFQQIYYGWLDKFQFKYMFDNTRNVEHQWFNSVLDFRFFLEIIRILKQKKTIIEVRPHPRENRNNWIKLNKKLNLGINIAKFEETFVDWINRHDLLICSASTSLYDCILLNKNVIVIDKLSKERAKHGNLYLDDFDPILNYLNRPDSLDKLKKMILKKKSIKITRNLSKLLKDEVNYPHHTSSLEKITDFINSDVNKNFRFDFIKYIKQIVFLILQNYTATKFQIKKFFGFKEVGSIFSLGFYRYIKIKNLANK